MKLGFNANQERMIDEAMRELLKPACQSTFTRHNLYTPAKVIRERGIIFIRWDKLNYNPPTEFIQAGFAKSSWDVLHLQAQDKLYAAPAFTTGWYEWDGQNLPVITVFFESAFNKKSQYSFEEIFVHEAIHRSGMYKDYSVCKLCNSLVTIGHDMANYKPYDEILENCGCPKGKRK